MNKRVSKTIGDIRFPMVVKIAVRWGYTLSDELEPFCHELLVRGGASAAAWQISALNIYLRVEGARARVPVKPLAYALAVEGLTPQQIAAFLEDCRRDRN